MLDCLNARFRVVHITIARLFSGARVRRLSAAPLLQCKPSWVTCAVDGNNEVSVWNLETGACEKSLWASHAPALSQTQVPTHLYQLFRATPPPPRKQERKLTSVSLCFTMLLCCESWSGSTSALLILMLYTAASCNKSVDILQQPWSTRRYQNVFAGLATAFWRQACCKLSTDLLEVDCQNCLSTGLLQVVTGLQMTSCNKRDFNRPVAT